MADSLSQVIEDAGHRVHRSHFGEAALAELRQTRATIRQTILTQFADQEVALDDPRGQFVMAVDGQPRRFQLFHGMRPDLKNAPWHGTPKERRRFIRLQHLMMAHRNADMAIDVYEQLRAEHLESATGIEMLAGACLNAGEQFANQLQWFMSQARESESRRKAAILGHTRSGDKPTPAEWQLIVAERKRRENHGQTGGGAAAEILEKLTAGKFPGIRRRITGIESETIRTKRLPK